MSHCLFFTGVPRLSVMEDKLRWCRYAVISFGISNAFLYTSLLPLWEGFDEPFHYGYVQSLANDWALPILGKTTLSKEITRSLTLAPASHVVVRNLPICTSFEAFFRLTPQQRGLRRQSLDDLPIELSRSSSLFLNYEAHQPPMAYFVMALVNSVFVKASLVHRVLLLRLFVALCSLALTYIGMKWLEMEFSLPHIFGSAALFCLVSTQMFWGTVGHISNDWLAVGMAPLLFAASIRLAKNRDAKSAYLLAGILSAGLLTKAYYLAFIPMFCVLLLICRKQLSARGVSIALAIIVICSGPWYVRNVSTYRNVSGTVEASAGLGPTAAAHAASAVPWDKTIPFMARASLWTGNNSFITFSRVTLNLMIAAVLLSMFRFLSLDWPSMVTTVGILSYSGALLYAAMISYMFTNQGSAGASPWYSEVLLAPVLIACAVGWSRSRTLGRWFACLSVLLWGYVIAATYLAKLIPLYSGFTGSQAKIGNLFDWYLTGDGQGKLDTAALAGSTMVYFALGLTVICGLAAGILVLYNILSALRRPDGSMATDNVQIGDVK